MSNTNINVTPGSGVSVNGYTTPDGDFNQGIVIVDPTTGKTASVTDNGAGQESLNISGSYKELSSLSAGALNADLIPATDVSAYKSFSIGIVNASFVGTMTLQGSNDNSNWFSVPAQASNNNSNALSTAPTAGGLWEGPIFYRYMRLRVTSYTSGSVSGTADFYTQPAAIHTIGAAVTSISATGSAVPGAAFYMGMRNVGSTLSPMQTANAQTDATDGSSALGVGPVNFNGTLYDRVRSNEEQTLLASAARTTTQTSADLVNYNGKAALNVVIDITAGTSPSLVVTIDRKDPASGKYINLLTSTTLATTGTTELNIGPDIAAVANLIAQKYMPRTFRIVVTAGNGNSITYSVGYSLTRG